VELAPALSLGKVTPAPFPSATPRAHPHSCFGVDQGHAFGVNLQIVLTYHVLVYAAVVSRQSGCRWHWSRRQMPEVHLMRSECSWDLQTTSSGWSESEEKPTETCECCSRPWHQLIGSERSMLLAYTDVYWWV